MIVVRTHQADAAGLSCVFCALLLPDVWRGGERERPRPGERVGVIEGAKVTAPTGYLVGKTDSNYPCTRKEPS